MPATRLWGMPSYGAFSIFYRGCKQSNLSTTAVTWPFIYRLLYAMHFVWRFCTAKVYTFCVKSAFLRLFFYILTVQVWLLCRLRGFKSKDVPYYNILYIMLPLAIVVEIRVLKSVGSVLFEFISERFFYVLITTFFLQPR